MFFAHPVTANIVGELSQMFNDLAAKANASWAAHDTLKYVAVSAVLFILARISHGREWNAMWTAFFAMGGIGCLIGSAFMFLLGDWARHTGSVTPQMVAREVRASHGEKIVPASLGEKCHTRYDCADEANVQCVQIASDHDTKCWANCGKLHGCPGKQKCEKVAGVHVCRP